MSVFVRVYILCYSGLSNSNRSDRIHLKISKKKIEKINRAIRSCIGVNSTPKKIRDEFIIITNVVLRLIVNNHDTYYINYRSFSNQYHVVGMANVLAPSQAQQFLL